LLPPLAGAALAVWTTMAVAAPVDLLSHRAAYRLSLADAGATSGLTGVQGGLVMEWRAGCDGWISNQRLGFVADTTEGSGFSYDVRFTSWESLDDTQLRFNVRSFDDGSMTDEFRGEASLKNPGADGEVHYSEPEGETIRLPEGTVFPTGHVRKLIEAAERGQLVVDSEVFDGSGPDALTRVSAVIGQARMVEVAASAGGAPATSEKRWPVSLAYHSLTTQSETPDFEISFAMNDGGVLYDLMLNYGDFTLKGDLEKLETFPAPSCN
jgi:hypothetical protein